MTQDDCNNSQSNLSLNDQTLQVQSGSSNESYDQVYINGEIDKTIWDAALASADDALVFVQWLDSKRP
mgnify:CR=1 FL=1|jgi:hypothetical protein